jgi:hypothetical protein
VGLSALWTTLLLSGDGLLLVQQARILRNFEAMIFTETHNQKFHHDENMASQKSFQKEVVDFVEIANNYGNPFSDETDHLVNLATREHADERVANTLKTIESLGNTQY